MSEISEKEVEAVWLVLYGRGVFTKLTDHYEQRIAIRSALSAAALARAEANAGEPVAWVARIGEILDEGDGFWRSCSGCHELNDGAPTGSYSAAFRTHVGVGCSECGGLGVVWDTTDYAHMGDWLAREGGFAAPQPSGPVKALEDVLEQAAHVELGLASRKPDVADATRELIRRVRAITAGKPEQAVPSGEDHDG